MKTRLELHRLRMLVRLKWMENKKLYLLLWGVISICLLILVIISPDGDELGLNLVLFCLGGCVMAATAFTRWTDAGRASGYLLLPATTTEKFLAGVFYGTILYIPAYCLNFFIVRYMLAYLVILPFPNQLQSFSAVIGAAFGEIASLHFTYYLVMFLAFLLVQSVFLVTYIRFRRMQVILAILFVLGILVVYNTAMPVWMSQLVHVHPGRIITPGIGLTFLGPDFGYTSGPAAPAVQYFSFIRPIRYLNDLVWLIIFVLIYLSAWSSLKEREI